MTKPQAELFPLTLHCQLSGAGLFPATPIGGHAGQTFLAVSSISQECDGGGCFPHALWQQGVRGLACKGGDTPRELRRVRWTRVCHSTRDRNNGTSIHHCWDLGHRWFFRGG